MKRNLKNIFSKTKIITYITILAMLLTFFVGCDIADTSRPSNDIDDIKSNQSNTEKVTDTSKKMDSSGDSVNISSIPKYSGSPYVVINNNIPSFNSDELTTTAYEKYSPLDSLGRCGVAIASCGVEIMPADGEERESISNVSPSGWKQAQYDCVNGKWLYNRSHLIGWQLSAENANAKNLITGTKYLNVQGMLPFENMVADYIRETNNHVAYRITPIFKGNNLLCSGVQMEAYSIEDDGDGICFNVYCYNVQPGVILNYATGASSLGNNDSANDTPPITDTEQNTSKTTYVLNTKTKKFHFPSCASANSISASNKQTFTGARETLITQGYDPCGNCDP